MIKLAGNCFSSKGIKDLVSGKWPSLSIIDFSNNKLILGNNDINDDGCE
jgi:hypothetical protein